MTDAIARIKAALVAYNAADYEHKAAATVDFIGESNPVAMAEVFDHIDAQQVEIAALRVDAERYRHLRGQARGEPVVWVDPERLDAISSGRAVPATLSGNRINRFTTALYTAPPPAHTEQEVQELIGVAHAVGLGVMRESFLADELRRILNVEAPK